MRKLTSIILTLAMVVSMCFGSVGSVYAAGALVNSFSSCSWEEIGEYVAKAEAGEITLSDYWSIGDTKSVTLTTGEVIELQIADFNHDTFDDGVTAPVTFVMKDPLETKAPMCSSISVDGYPATDMPAYLETNIYDKLPADLKAIVAPVKKEYNTSSSLGVASYNVWLLSEMEVLGTNEESAGSGDAQYPLFQDDDNINKGGRWWLRTARSNAMGAYRCVSNGLTSRPCTEEAGVVAGLCVRGTTQSTDTDVIDVTVPERIDFVADANGNISSDVIIKNNNAQKLKGELGASTYGDWEMVPKSSVNSAKKFYLKADGQDLLVDTYKFSIDASKSIEVELSGIIGPVTEDIVSERFVTVTLTISRTSEGG